MCLQCFTVLGSPAALWLSFQLRKKLEKESALSAIPYLHRAHIGFAFMRKHWLCLMRRRLAWARSQNRADWYIYWRCARLFSRVLVNQSAKKETGEWAAY